VADIPDAVLSTREAKAHLSDFLKEARAQGREAPIHYYGAQRRPEAVVMSAERAHMLLDVMDEVVILQTVLERADEPVDTGTVEDFLTGAGIDADRIRKLRAERRGA
jgi:hypothetical protein